MSFVYLLFPGTIPELETIKTQLGGNYTFVNVNKLEALSEYREAKGVILLGGDPTRLGGVLGMMRSIAPRLGCVVVAETEQLPKIQEVASLQDIDVLMVPCHPLEIKTRLDTAIHISELRHLIETSAQLDEVTELYSHQYFLKRLGEEMSLAKRHLSPVTCVIMGISYYDVFLDSYGYQFVSNMVHQIAMVTLEQVRAEDIVARLGDSEIAFLLPRSTEKGAGSLTQRIIDKVENLPLYMGDQVERIHLKAGIAGFPMAGEGDIDPDTLIRYARHALHQARCSDKKQVQLFSEMKPHVS